MTIDNQTGLVLEGGGMRGVFTCGVLDYLMDHDIRFPYTIGVSAGACNGLSYMSRQRGRAKYSNIDLLEVPLYRIEAFAQETEYPGLRSSLYGISRTYSSLRLSGIL